MAKARARSLRWSTVDSAGFLYVADGYHNTILKVTPASVVTVLAGAFVTDALGNILPGLIELGDTP